MLALLYMSVGYLLITSLILLFNRIYFVKPQHITQSFFDEELPDVCICIPARNEAGNIEKCVRSIFNQRYTHFELHVIDDHSSDETWSILKRLQHDNPRKMFIYSAKPKPDDWLGKSWACHQLAQETKSEMLIFIDADTWLAPQTISRIIQTMQHDAVDLATLWPQQQVKSFWEKLAIPQLYMSLLTLLPSRFVHRLPRWIPSSVRQKIAPFFTAACGQFMAFRRHTYEAVGGHQSVKNHVVEDVELAKNVKRAGFSMKMYHGSGSANCRMYRSAGELWQGFRKNFLAGFGYNILLFVTIGLLHDIIFVLPVLFLPFALIFYQGTLLFLTATAIVLILFQRFMIARWFNWNPWYSLVQFLGVLWFQLLAIQTLLDYFRDRPVFWKGRQI